MSKVHRALGQQALHDEDRFQDLTPNHKLFKRVATERDKTQNTHVSEAN